MASSMVGCAKHRRNTIQNSNIPIAKKIVIREKPTTRFNEEELIFVFEQKHQKGVTNKQCDTSNLSATYTCNYASIKKTVCDVQSLPDDAM